MPTGYTHSLCEGNVSFNQFVWCCARAMGALIMMRDEPLDKAPPDKLPGTDDYHVKALKEAKSKLARLRKMSASAAQKNADRDYKSAVKAHENHVADVAAVRERLDYMREKVVAWTPPTSDHSGLKDFMLDQLDQTIRHDGTVSSYYEDRIKKLTGMEWLKEQIASAEHSVDYHTRELALAQARDKDRQDWIDALRASVPYELQNTAPVNKAAASKKTVRRAPRRKKSSK